MNKKKLFLIVLVVLCCAAAGFAQGAKEALEDLGYTYTYTPAGIPELVPIAVASERYQVACYVYQFDINGRAITFKFIDSVGKDDIPVIAKALMDVIPSAQSYTNPKAGSIVISTKNYLTTEEFNAFVKKAEDLIYDTIY